jgi:hypothetical protein
LRRHEKNKEIKKSKTLDGIQNDIIVEGGWCWWWWGMLVVESDGTRENCATRNLPRNKKTLENLSGAQITSDITPPRPTQVKVKRHFY